MGFAMSRVSAARSSSPLARMRSAKAFKNFFAESLGAWLDPHALRKAARAAANRTSASSCHPRRPGSSWRTGVIWNQTSLPDLRIDVVAVDEGFVRMSSASPLVP